MKAIVVKETLGKPDNSPHERHFAEGETIWGDLAVLAVKEGWATEEGQEKPKGKK